MPYHQTQLGEVKLVQIQPNGLIIEDADTPNGQIYDPSRLVQVKRLEITPLGIQADIPGRDHVLDIHHINHPDKKYGDDDLVSVGFTAHYRAMRDYFGEHMTDGIGGENIIIEYSQEVWPDDLEQKLGVENQETGEVAILDMVSHASPCVEFSHFSAQSQHEKLSAQRIKEILQFLENGRRGYLFVLSKIHDVISVRPGDKVFVLSE